MHNYMNVAIEEAKKSLIYDDIPVGAVIIFDGKIISQAHNEKEIRQNAIMHAELIAIDRACKKMKNWHLDGCVLVTTMEPCMMCCGAITQSRIKKIIYGVENKKFGCTKILKEKFKIDCIKIENDKEIVALLQDFFKKRR